MPVVDCEASEPNHGVTFVVNVNRPTPLNIVTDITVLDAKPIGTVSLQYQQSGQSCWIAAATTVDHFYHSDSFWTQCAVMSEIGHEINGFPATTGACTVTRCAGK